MNVLQIVRQSLKNHVQFVFQNSHNQPTLQKQSNIFHNVIFLDNFGMILTFIRSWFILCLFLCTVNLTPNQGPIFSKNLMGLKNITFRGQKSLSYRRHTIVV